MIHFSCKKIYFSCTNIYFSWHTCIYLQLCRWVWVKMMSTIGVGEWMTGGEWCIAESSRLSPGLPTEPPSPTWLFILLIHPPILNYTPHSFIWILTVNTLSFIDENVFIHKNALLMFRGGGWGVNVKNCFSGRCLPFNCNLTTRQYPTLSRVQSHQCCFIHSQRYLLLFLSW